ncbi:MFS transporter [Nonomuraea lactucae]|uniref:MFS transporter n=1 Tax=Nonomuraea lactucae TaxID=2249762 RepID=UPI000DE2A4CE|nr:MFS transporter [Nonomuraea lactucae]
MPQSLPPHGGLSVAARLNRLPVTGAHKRLVFVVALGNFFEVYEWFVSAVLATKLVATFNLGVFELSLLLSSVFVGAFVGAAVIGRLSDRIGRRKAYMLTLGFYSLGTLGCAFAPDLWTLLLFRFIAGVGLGGELPVTDAYLGDVLPPRKRGYYAAWAYTAAYLAVPFVGFLGMLIADGTLAGVSGWRWMFAIGALGAVITFFVRRGLPESPRWLASVGRAAEADEVTRIFERAAVANGWTPPEGPAEPEAAETKALPVRTIFRAPYTRRTVLMGMLWILAPVGYYGFSNVATLALAQKGHTVTDSLMYLTLSFVGYPLGSYLSMVIMERLERKWFVAASLAGMAVFGIGYGSAGSAVTIVACGFFFTLTANLMSNSGRVYQLEQFPTSLRTTSTGILYSLSRLSAVAAPFYLIPILYSHGPVAVFGLVAMALLVPALSLAVWGVRTTGLPVEAIAGTSPAPSPVPAQTGSAGLGPNT